MVFAISLATSYILNAARPPKFRFSPILKPLDINRPFSPCHNVIKLNFESVLNVNLLQQATLPSIIQMDWKASTTLVYHTIVNAT
jgi:hypothetical protein